ncbi:unnamed protein product [Ceutorhynchus assimilis]|uniref:GH18 domain-containing protein n=1 Tax=Ceutorhynchus assimilis TaxID=467358 RepID=A0A9N9QHP3_9CUCU|nr:unnamed protein product [Ceutorhynchus assimilis]
MNQIRNLLVLILTCSNLTFGAEIVCYFTNWAVYRQGIAKFQVSNIDPHLCTIINYAFVGLNGNTGELKVLDDWSDNGLGNVKKVIGLKQQNKKLKVLISMGGWTEGSTKYSHVAASPTLRATFVKSVLKYIKAHGFNGFDLDWEYPVSRNGSPKDVQNFVTLLSELKRAFKPFNYLLTIAVPGGGSQVGISYDVPKLMNVVDYVNLMLYDFRMATSVRYAAHHSPFHPCSQDSGENRQLSASGGIHQWIALGAKPSKLILGIPFYARSFKLHNANKHKLYDPTDGPGPAGPLSKVAGFLSYQEICKYYKDATYVWNDQQQSPHSYKGTTWYGYDDPRSVGLKAQYARKTGLAGVMVWDLDFDDFNNSCGKGKYPLLTAINKALKFEQ